MILSPQKPPCAAFARALAFASLWICALAGAQQKTQEKQTNSPPALQLHRSVFDPSLKEGRDPFFPNSSRRAQRSSVSFEVIKPSLPPITQLALNGLSARYAVINNRTFAENEEGPVQIPSGQVRIHCRKILPRSVIITIEGDPERKELHLRDDI